MNGSTLLRAATASLLLLPAIPAAAGAQTTAADSAAIHQTAMDYIEGWYEGNAERMARALHPDLAKRIVFPDGRFSHMTARQLIDATKSGGGKGTPVEEQQKDYTLLDVFGGAAVVKVVARDWIDYLQIAKYEGQWVIVNVLWEVKSGS